MKKQSEIIRLIDANAVLKVMKETYCTDCNNYNGVWCRACEHMDDMDFIEDAPTIDAQPVKRGQWVTSQQTLDDGVVTCSYCHVEYSIDDLVQVGNEEGCCEFCPHCGADMRGEANGDADYTTTGFEVKGG